jgi:hypothetical protein
MLTGCGGGEGADPFTAEQVARAFERVTGDQLVSDPGASRSGTKVLRLDQAGANATLTSARYGTFSIYVVTDGDPKPLYAKSLKGESLHPGRDGVYWRQLSADPPTWQASKPYRNVVLQWQAGRRRATDARFDRLDAALSSLVSARPVELPPEDRPCDQVGIDPRRGREGTCKLGAQTLVVVNRGHTLRLPAYDLGRVRVSVTRQVTSSDLRGFARAKGRFVVLRFQVRNRSDEPLERVTPTLTVRDKRYALDTRALFLFQQHTPFPIQPGDRSEVVALYDIPLRAAREVGRRGALIVDGNPAGAAATIEGATVLGRVRL